MDGLLDIVGVEDGVAFPGRAFFLLQKITMILLEELLNTVQLLSNTTMAVLQRR